MQILRREPHCRDPVDRRLLGERDFGKACGELRDDAVVGRLAREPRRAAEVGQLGHQTSS